MRDGERERERERESCLMQKFRCNWLESDVGSAGTTTIRDFKDVIVHQLVFDWRSACKSSG